MSRLRLFAGVASLTLLVLSAKAAHAAEDSMQGPSCAVVTGAEDTATIPLAAALFTAHRTTPEALTWDARFILDVDAAFELGAGAPTTRSGAPTTRGRVLSFAAPLPLGETLRAMPGIAALVARLPEGERIVGLCVGREALHDRTILASFVQPFMPASDTDAPLGAPVAAGSAVQIIDSPATADSRLEVTAGRVLERHVGYIAPRSVSHGAREEARRLTATRARVTESPVYIRGDDLRSLGGQGGVRGRFVDPRARTRSNALGVGLLFAGIVGALVVAARKLRHSASVARADALLASEIDAVSTSSQDSR